MYTKSQNTTVALLPTGRNGQACSAFSNTPTSDVTAGVSLSMTKLAPSHRHDGVWPYVQHAEKFQPTTVF